MTARAVTVLPQPLSPTSPTVSPEPTAKLTSSVTRSHPEAVANSTESPSTDSNGEPFAAAPAGPGSTLTSNDSRLALMSAA